MLQRLAEADLTIDNRAVHETGQMIALGALGVVAVVAAVGGSWLWGQRKRVEQTERWSQAEATIESGRFEAPAQGRVSLPTFAFSYNVAGNYYSGRFASHAAYH
ncbi:MAG TPA: hypothetical protein VN682_10420 [Terriglobales bacterium]|nr:hypothetical protein [Terriglobales bacterium]